MQVFEDRSEGIICYRDDSGEIICEGIDEGPRYHQQIPRTASYPRYIYTQVSNIDGLYTL